MCTYECVCVLIVFSCTAVQHGDYERQDPKSPDEMLVAEGSQVLCTYISSFILHLQRRGEDLALHISTDWLKGCYLVPQVKILQLPLHMFVCYTVKTH